MRVRQAFVDKDRFKVVYEILKRPITSRHITLTVAPEIVPEHTETILQNTRDRVPDIERAAQTVYQDHGRVLCWILPGTKNMRIHGARTQSPQLYSMILGCNTELLTLCHAPDLDHRVCGLHVGYRHQRDRG